MFDRVVVEDQIEYGILKGNDTIIYIKVGDGGNIYGYKNKYLLMAKQINEQYGYSIVVASNSVDISLKEKIKKDICFIEKEFATISEVMAFGHSNGGQMLLTHAYEFPIVRKVVAVNAPLMINLHKTKNGIENFQGNKMIAIYGDKDPSYMYVALLDSCKNDVFNYVIIEDVDHHFTNKLKLFINLPEDHLII